MKTKLIKTAALTSMALLFAAAASGQATVPNTHVMAAADTAYDAAAKEGRRTLPTFLAKWRAKPEGYAAFRVKAAFRTDDGRGEEDLWFEPVSVAANGALTGRLSDRATRIGALKAGGQVTVLADRVVDWMYVKDRRMFGQFTMRAQLGRMPPAQRAQYEAILSPTPLGPGGH